MVSLQQFNQMSINDKESMKFVLDSFGNVAIRVRNMGGDPIPTAYNASGGTFPVVASSPAWFIISVAGTLPAPVGTVKVGDIIVRDGTTRTAISYVTVGNMTGPASSINSAIAIFDGVTGKIIKDSTILLSSLQTTLTANVDYLTPGTAASTYQVKMIANQNYVTDAQLVVIGNTSGTNTGDETATTIKTKLGITTLSGSNTGDNATNTQYSGLATSKQDTLVSGTNIKTINGNSILGSGDLSILGGHIIETAGTPLTQRTKLNFIGSGVTVSDGGAVTDDTIVTINTGGYTLPTASATVLGGVKIGSRLTMTGDILSADATDLSGQLHLDQTTSQTIANGQPIRGTLTASQLLATDASKKMQSLDVATYPSLTELTYLKGVTSSIQTQINSKGTGTVTGTGTTDELTYRSGSGAIGTLPVATYPSKTELSYVKGVTSGIQAQINGKAGTATATTSANGLAPQATAPASGLYNYLGITNGETAYTNKALFDATVPVTQAFGDAAAVGTAAVAARRDHKHAMMAAPTTISGNAGTATALANGRVFTVTDNDATNSQAAATAFDGTVAYTVKLPATIKATITGTATNVSGTPALPNGTTATTQSANDNSTKLATTAYADLKIPKAGGTASGKITMAGKDEVAKTYTPASGSQTVALDCTVNNQHVVTGNASGTAITFTITGDTNNQIFIVSILQGSGTVSTIAGWFATIRWAGGVAPTLTATLNKRDTFGFIRTGTNTYDGFVIGQNC